MPSVSVPAALVVAGGAIAASTVLSSILAPDAPKLPDPASIVAPSVTDPTVQANAENARLAAAAGGGQGGTILTSGLGLANQPTVLKQTLGGN